MRSDILVIIFSFFIVTFATRFGCVALFRQTKMPVWLERWLRHIPTAILTALIIPALILPKGQVDITLHNHYLLAGILAAIVAYKSRNIVSTIVLGMGTMIVLRLID